MSDGTRRRLRHRPYLTMAALLTAVAGMPATAGAARPAKPASCQAGKTWAANERLRLFQWGETPDGFGVRFWVCRAGARTPRFLVTRSAEYPDPIAAIGGSHVLFPRRECGTLEDGKSDDVTTCRAGITTYDARRDRTRFVRLGKSTDGLVPLVGAIAVTARGWGAWVTIDASSYDHQQIWVLAPAGEPEMVAETNRRGSEEIWAVLALSGDRLLWRIGDQLGTRLLR